MEINHQQAISIMNKRSNTSQLDSTTKSNYMQAASYYTAKKQAFLQKIQNNMQNQDLSQEQLEQIVEKQLEETYNMISTIWNKLDSLIMDMVVHDETINSTGTRGEKITNAISKIIGGDKSQKFREKLETYNLNDTELKIVTNIYKKINLNTMLKKGDNEDNEYINSSFASILGQAFEPFVAQALNCFAEQCGIIGQECVNSLIDSFAQTGDFKISSNTATKVGGKSISPDVAMNVNNSNVTSADLTVKENADIKKMIHKNSTKTDASIGQRLYELLNSPNSAREQMFGFSLKRWKDGEQNKEYTSSSVIQAQLNQIFHTKETWNYKYAFARGQLELSKNAIALFGPINIGVFTTHGFTWMDDFIKNRRLFMNIYSYIKPNYGEILPYVESGDIYIHNYNKEKQDKIAYKKAGYDFDNLPYYKISFQSVIGK